MGMKRVGEKETRRPTQVDFYASLGYGMHLVALALKEFEEKKEARLSISVIGA